MLNNATAIDLNAIQDTAKKLDACLKPIANRPIDVKHLDSLTSGARASPLQEAGIEEEAEGMLLAAIALYAKADGTTRDSLRQLFSQTKSLAWAAGWAGFAQAATVNSDQFRQQLLLFSLIDQGQDSRDAILQLQYFTKTARTLGIDTRSILEEIAVISSDQNKYGMGSTKQMMLSLTQ